MSASDAAKRGSGVAVPLGARLKAWWHGYDLQVRHKAQAAERPAHAVAYEADLPPWERADLAVPQRIWGDGFLTPGGPARAGELIKPLGLDSSMSVLQVGCGLGGLARYVAQASGAYVTGIEADRDLADIAQRMSDRDGLAKKAKVHPFDPAHVEFRPRAFDVAICDHALHRFEEKETLLGAVADALKGRCQLLIVDYVLAPEAEEAPALAAWMAAEPRPVHLWTVQEYRNCINGLRFDMRVCADITAEQRRTVVGGFAQYLSAASQAGVEDRLKEALVDEVERCTRLVAALDSGALQLVRIFAHRAQRETMMSDW
jgi:2-polyprenyl-3-methyl-5-hydroxy-6-metoxy-1,4-benzoquinol methylase